MNLLDERVPSLNASRIICKTISEELQVRIVIQSTIIKSRFDSIVKVVAFQLSASQNLITVEEVLHPAVVDIAHNHGMKFFCYHRFQGICLKIDRRNIPKQCWEIDCDGTGGNNITKTYIQAV